MFLKGIPVLAVESDSDRTEGPGQSRHVGKTVPGKLAHCRLPLCKSHQASVLSHTLSRLAVHTFPIPTLMLLIGKTKGRLRGTENDTIERKGKQQAFYFLP